MPLWCSSARDVRRNIVCVFGGGLRSTAWLANACGHFSAAAAGVLLCSLCMLDVPRPIYRVTSQGLLHLSHLRYSIIVLGWWCGSLV